MRRLVSSHRLRCLSQVGLVSVLAALAGCSSDFTRFDRTLYSALPQSTNQNAANPYPGNVDPMTTASVRAGHPVPIGNVEQQIVASDHTGYQPANYNGQPQRQPLGTYQPTPTYQPAPARSASVTSSALPSPTATNSQVELDPVKTSSVSSVKSQAAVSPLQEQPAPDGVGGWSAAGGTSVSLRSGETLYNLSKRYGVPVKEIMRVNDISNANNVQAGQRIVIPTYVYSRSAPISAPDNNPKTKAASATRGNLGQANPNTAITPSKRPEQVASLNAQGTQSQDKTLVPTRKLKPWTEDTQENVPDHSIVTGSVSAAKDLSANGYKVVSGDSLSKIASRYGISTASLMQANGLTSSNIRIGQVLKIPGIETAKKVVSTVKAPLANAPKPYVPPTVDKTVTSSLDTKAPESTGISKLRWPVDGRVVSAFGSSKNGRRNDGIDISVPEGTAVKAAENGVVIYSGSDLEDFGNLVLIRHQDGLVTAYAHNKYNNVRKNDQVKRGQVIAASGRTGSASTPMLHFEVRKNSKPVDPKKYLGG